MKKGLFLLAVILCLGCSALAEGQAYHSDFSAGTDGWYPRSMGQAQLEVTEDGLKITGRTATWNSPGRAFDLAPNEVYRISLEVKQDEIPSARFMLSAEHARDGETSYENLVSADCQMGEWVTLAAVWNAGDWDTYVLYVETIHKRLLEKRM